MTIDQLRKAEAEFRKDYQAAERSRERRNELVREAFHGGLSLQEISDATGLTRGRISQIAGGKSAKAA